MSRAFIAGQPLSAFSVPIAAPDRDFGDANLGDVTILASADLQGDLQYNNLTINDTFRVAAVAQTKLTIRTQGDLTLNGSATIDAHGRGLATTPGGAGGAGSTNGSGPLGLPGQSGGPVGVNYSPLVASGSGGGGGGAGVSTSGQTWTGGRGGNGTAGSVPRKPFTSQPAAVELIGRVPALSRPSGTEARAIFILLANTLKDGDYVFFAVGTTDSDTIEVFFEGIEILQDSSIGGSGYTVTGRIHRQNSTTAMGIATGTDDSGSGAATGTTGASISAVDWTVDNEIVVLSTSGNPHSIDYFTVWKNGNAGGEAGLGGAGAQDVGVVSATVGSQGAVIPTDPILRSRIESDKDLAAIATAFWGAPGGSGGGGGGAKSGSLTSIGGGGASAGSQSTATGFGNGNTGSTGGGLSVVGSHATGGGGGGSGGAGGGNLEVWCNGDLTIGTGTINANAGNGGNGGNGGDSTVQPTQTGTGGGGGGGGGGAGGTVLIVVNGTPTNVSGATITATGGAQGAGGSSGTIAGADDGFERGAGGSAGRTGDDGFVILIGA